MEQGDINEQFQDIARLERIRDIEAMIDQILNLEAHSRHLLGCDDNRAGAEAAANEVYALLMTARMSEIPTIVINMADRYNREHDIVAMLLDALDGARIAIEEADGHLSSGRPAIASTYMTNAYQLIMEALDRAPYERVDNESNTDGGGGISPDGF